MGLTPAFSTPAIMPVPHFPLPHFQSPLWAIANNMHGACYKLIIAVGKPLCATAIITFDIKSRE